MSAPGGPVDPGAVAAVQDLLAAASVGIAEWLQAVDGASRVRAGNQAVVDIDQALAALHTVRQRLATEIHRRNNESMHRCDRVLASVRGMTCLHGDDSRHGTVFGPVEYVGCGCELPCCARAEAYARARDEQAEPIPPSPVLPAGESYERPDPAPTMSAGDGFPLGGAPGRTALP